MIRAKNVKTFGAAPKVPQHKRRKAVEGEDLPALKAIMKDIEGQRITVEDFILLVAPHTGDKGAALTKVMTLDINAFRKFVNEAYDTMSSDTSEVMAKTQMELSELYVEKHHVLTHNMIKCLKSIQDYIVDFDLHLYTQNPERYLASHFKIADIPDSEEVEQARRQLAYHRLNWLKSEGDRLAVENTKLQKRLNELKKIQQGEIVETIRKEKEAEQQRIALEHQQEEMQNKLENLVEELHDTIVTEEENMTQSRIEVQKQTITKKFVSKTAKNKTPKTKDSVWSIRAAQGIEKAKLKKTTASQSTLVQEAIKKKSSGKTQVPSRYAQGPSSTAATAQAAGTSQLKTGTKKMVKKTAPVIQRPEWQDVNLDEFASSSDAGCPPACPGNAPTSTTYSGGYGQQASSSRAPPRQDFGSSQYKTGAKRIKKTAPVTQRPEWQDVNLDEFASSSDAGCPPACPGNAPSPSTYSGRYAQQASSSRAPPRQAFGSSQNKAGASKMKKTARVIQRPEWQDVNLDEFASPSNAGCPPTCPGNPPPPPTDGCPPSCP